MRGRREGRREERDGGREEREGGREEREGGREEREGGGRKKEREGRKGGRKGENEELTLASLLGRCDQLHPLPVRGAWWHSEIVQQEGQQLGSAIHLTHHVQDVRLQGVP